MKRFISLILSATMFMSALSIQTVFATNINPVVSTGNEAVTLFANGTITPNNFYKVNDSIFSLTASAPSPASFAMNESQLNLYKESYDNMFGEPTVTGEGKEGTFTPETAAKLKSETIELKLNVDSDGEYCINLLAFYWNKRGFTVTMNGTKYDGTNYTETLYTNDQTNTPDKVGDNNTSGQDKIGTDSVTQRNLGIHYAKFKNLKAGEHTLTLSYNNDGEANKEITQFYGLYVKKIGDVSEETKKPEVEAGPLATDTYYNAAQLFDNAISTTAAEDTFTMSNSQKTEYEKLGNGNNIFGTPETSGDETTITPEYKVKGDISKKEIDVNIDNDGEYSVYLLAKEYVNKGYKITMSDGNDYTETIQTDVANGGSNDTRGQILIGSRDNGNYNLGIHYAKFNLAAGKYKLTLEGAESQPAKFYGLNIIKTGDYVQQPTKPGVEEGPLATGTYYNAAQLFDSATKATADTYTVDDTQKTAYEKLGTEVFGALETSGNDTTITPEYKVENGITKKEIKVNVTEAGKYSVYLLANQWTGRGYKITMADGKDYTETLQTDVEDGSSTDTNGQVEIGTLGSTHIGVHYAQFNLAAGEYTLVLEGATTQPTPFYGLNIVKTGDYVKPVDPQPSVDNVIIKDENVTLSENGTLSYTLTLPEGYNSETTNYFVVLRNKDENDSFIGVNANGPETGSFTGLNSGSTYILKVYTWNTKMQPIGETFVKEVTKTTTTE